jgi:hypothetical protein
VRHATDTSLAGLELDSLGIQLGFQVYTHGVVIRGIVTVNSNNLFIGKAPSVQC